MKLIIAGSRQLLNTPMYDWVVIEKLIQYLGINPDEVVTGGAYGVDEAGDYYADIAGHERKEFPADWNTHGKAAGPIRNKEMAIYGDVLLLIWDSESRGSKNMKEEMLKLNKPVYEVILRKYNAD